MKKIPSIFERDWEGDRRLVTNRPTEAYELIASNPSCYASAKWDGTATMVMGGALFKRYDCKNGKPAPEFFVQAQEPDEKTGHWPGWVPVVDEQKADQWLLSVPHPMTDGTYEFCGPRVNSNPHGFSNHLFIRHGMRSSAAALRDYEWFYRSMADFPLEGLVWWLNGEPIGKIKRSDFGWDWPIK